MKRIQILLGFLKPYRKRVLLAFLGTALFNVLALSPPLILRRLVDRVVLAENWSLLVPVVAVYIAVPILFRFIHFGNVLNIVFLGQRLVSDVRLRMYRLLMRLSMRYHGDNAAGALLARLMGDVNMVQHLMTAQTIQLFGDVIVLAFSVVVAFTIDVRLAWILLVVIVLYVVVYMFFVRRIRRATQSMRTINDRVFSRLNETLEGVRQVRIYNREGQERELFLDRTSTGLERQFNSGMSSVGLGAACGLIAGYGSTVIYALAAYFVLKRELTLGDLLALNAYVWMALQPALRLTSFAGQISQVGVSIERIFDVLDESPEVVSTPGARDLARVQGRVEFRDVVFGYTPESTLYHDLNLVVEPGMTVALVGHTGCGKTTMTSLLMRLWDIRDGQILVDGHDVRNVSLSSLRSQFGVVLQDPVIFEGTLAENIAYGEPNAPTEAIAAAAEAAEVTEFVARLPDGLDTVLGSYGVKLSVGEKQRVSIARALLKDPAILVMDEATSALDSRSEALIQKALTRVLTGRTSFVVAHRLSTIVGADLIVVMDNGRIVEQGTQPELMDREQGVYRGLYEEMCQSTSGGES